MKRKWSVWWIWLAGIVILVHGVVPHHHHNRLCGALAQMLEIGECLDYQHCHCPAHQRHHHHGHGHEGAAQCQLTDAAPVSLRIGSRDADPTKGDSQGWFTDLWVALPSDAYIITANDSGTPRIWVACILLSALCPGGWTLRGPPVH